MIDETLIICAKCGRNITLDGCVWRTKKEWNCVDCFEADVGKEYNGKGVMNEMG